MTERSELDELAIQMRSEVDRFIGDQNASKNFVLIDFAADDSTGVYPQAKLATKDEYSDDDGDAPYDSFPVPIRKGPINLKLARGAKWTDVMSSQLWSEGFLLNDKAMEVFGKFELENTKAYPATVTKGREKREYNYLFIANHFSLDDVDFVNSEFYLADMLGSPLRMIQIDSPQDLIEKRKAAMSGTMENTEKFSRVDCKKIQLKKTPKAAIFGTRNLNVDMYVTADLYQALRASGITGLQFKRNNMLFD